MTQQGEIINDVVDVQAFSGGAWTTIQPDGNGKYPVSPGVRVRAVCVVWEGLCSAISFDADAEIENPGTNCDPNADIDGNRTRYEVNGLMSASASGDVNLTIDTGTAGEPPAGGAGAESVTITFDVQ
ncbi:MAG: hypothetical protein ACF8XB_05970 [Planctomycetota bacterium JB042]